MNYRKFFASMLLGTGMMFGLAGNAQSADIKIGYVDVKSAVENTRDYQAGIKRLEAMKSKKQKELNVLLDKINQAEKDLMGQSMAMSPDRLAEKQQQLKDMRKDLQRKQQDAQEELVAEKNRLDMNVGSKFQQVMKDFGKKNGYDMIMARSAFLYVDPKHDVTAQITKLLDAK